MKVATFQWKKNHLEVLDQRLLPHKTKYIKCRTVKEVARTIKDMAVRGAPAIGCVAAYGMALAAKKNQSLLAAAKLLKSSRPTAVNLAWAVNRVLTTNNVLNEAKKIHREDLAANKKMGQNGAKLFKKRSTLLTHCNAGALATAGYGTALGVIRATHKRKKIKKVFVDETRPYLQGARLTAWELDQERIPHELITDNMAAHFIHTEGVDGIVVGCDRVAANGDTANKIGTYNLAVLAKHHKVPFYVAMPTSTLDLSLPSGKKIPIENRSHDEVVRVGKVKIAPKRTRARHPAFDVTPATLITAFITENGIVRPPFKKNLKWIIQKP